MATAEPVKVPAPRPCESCPYRRDVPSGIWDAHEYLKLLDYDQPMERQPTGAFLCHQNDGRLCAGWVGCHGTETLAIRLLAYHMSEEDVRRVAWYTTDVPLFESGRDACLHGLRDLQQPGPEAQRMMDKLLRKGKAHADERPA